MVTGVFAMQPAGDVLAVVSVANSTMPLHLVTDARVSINGLAIPRYAEGFMYVGPFAAGPGDSITLTVERGITVTASLPLSGKATFTRPTGGVVYDPQQPITVAWTAPAIVPQQYQAWISDMFTRSPLGWSQVASSAQSQLDIPARTLNAGQTGVTVTIQAQSQTDVFEGPSLAGSTFTVSNHSESAAFSTL